MTAPQTTSASYEVGYRKPPRHTQFQKGHSGNPGGRPRRPARRLEELALYEAYRTTIVMEDGHAIPMPAIQAVLRRQLESAASGNIRAQRDILAMIRDIERVRSIAALLDDGGADVVVDIDDADAIDGDGNEVVDSADLDDNDVDDAANADRDDAGGADGKPARQQADGIDTHGERRQAEREPVELVARVERSETREHPLNAAPPPPGFAGAQPGLQRSSSTAPLAVGGPQPENATAPPAGRAPSLPSGSGSGQRRGVPPRRNGPEWSAGAKPARSQPGRRRRSPAVDVSKMRERSSRRAPGRTNAPAQAAGGDARATAAPAKRDEKLKTRC
jgi:Family of unknown function (DUF5681)